MQIFCGFLLPDKWSLTHSNVVLQYYSLLLYYCILLFFNSKTLERIQFRTSDPTNKKEKKNPPRKTRLKQIWKKSMWNIGLKEAFKILILILFIGYIGRIYIYYIWIGTVSTPFSDFALFAPSNCTMFLVFCFCSNFPPIYFIICILE